jgi:hypothetical protein
MNKLEILKNELNVMVENDTPYSKLVEKSKELDYYITQEMIRMHKKEINLSKWSIKL